MRCCAPFCKNTPDNVSPSEREGKEISFHGLPSEVHLRAAWLRALGKQDNSPDSAVVCSQHFLSDDLYETESGLWQIRTGAIPSTVQVCMICLDTDSKLLLMSKHKLEEAYVKLTGQPLCDQGNLKHTICIQCAQRLINFSRFRDKSLRARALMMDLVEKHELITRRHIKMINRTKHQLKSNMRLTTLAPDHCDLHILEHLSEDKQTELKETGLQVLVKTEGCDDSMSVDEDMELINEDDNIADNVKDEFVTSDDENSITLDENELDEALQTKHLQADPRPSVHSSQTLVAPLPASLATNNEIKVSPTEEADTDVSCQYNRLTDCFVKLHDVFYKNVVQRRDETLKNTRKAVRSCVSQNIVSKDISYQATSQNKVPSTESLEPVINTVKALQNKTDCLTNVINIQCNYSSKNSSHIEEREFICDICKKMYKRKSVLVKHIKTHAEVRRFTCEICQYKCKYQSYLKRHMRTHTGIKPFSCKFCDHKCTTNSNLLRHMRTHTGIKPFLCKLCDYKCTTNDSLMAHMRTHTSEKPFSCKLCNYKCATNSNLVKHMRTHTGEKPYSCKLCNYKCAQNSHLVTHMRTHTGEKPYSCKICNYKFADNSTLVTHMRTHTGEKPYSCKICEYKCTKNSHLVTHMRSHTGEKPYSCKICEYKCTTNSHLVTHMRTHTGEKPYSCKICEYKCAHRTSLMNHMRTHTATGEKPSSCP